MLDLRMPIGYFFLINGALLIGDGLLQPNAILYAGYTINLDVVWGALLLAFGVFMTALAYSSRGKSSGTAADTAAKTRD